jgi:hypothetical protein
MIVGLLCALGTHKPLVAGSNPAAAIRNLYIDSHSHAVQLLHIGQC